MKKRILLLVLSTVLLFFQAVMKAQGILESRKDNAILSTRIVARYFPPGSIISQDVVFPEDVTPPDSFRLEKNRRYNLGEPDLTKQDYPRMDSIMPRGLPVLPVADSTVILKGEVEKIQPYLSQDKGSIYTEFKVKVEELIKETNVARRITDRTYILDQQGGKLRLSSGQIISDPIIICRLGRPLVSERVIIFANEIHGGVDLQIIKAYMVRKNFIYAVSDKASNSNSTQESNSVINYGREKDFLNKIRQKVAGKN